MKLVQCCTCNGVFDLEKVERTEDEEFALPCCGEKVVPGAWRGTPAYYELNKEEQQAVNRHRGGWPVIVSYQGGSLGVFREPVKVKRG